MHFSAVTVPVSTVECGVESVEWKKSGVMSWECSVGYEVECQVGIVDCEVSSVECKVQSVKCKV